MKINITIDEDTIMDAIRAGHRAHTDTPQITDGQAKAWLAKNRDKVEEYLTNYAIDAAIRSVLRPPVEVKEPMLSFDNGRLQLFVYDAEEIVRLPVLKACGNDWNAGMVYVERSIGEHEYEWNIREKSIWEWIQKYMEMGMRAEQLMTGEKTLDKPE